MNQKIKLTRIFYLIIFYLFLISYVICDDCSDCIISGNTCVYQTDENPCPEKCKPKLFGTSDIIKCYECSETIDTYFQIESGGSCHFISDCSQKIVIGTNECVNSCENGFEFYDYCYSSCPEHSMVSPEGSNICKCIYKLYIRDGKYYCTENDDCPDNYNSFYNNQCFLDSTSITDVANKKRKKVYRENRTLMIRYSDGCNSDEDFINDYCVDRCTQKYYYPEEGNKICVSSCSGLSEHKYEKINGECVLCNNPEEFIDGNKCVSSCTSGFVEQVGNICINSEPASNCVYLSGDGANKKCYTSCLEIPIIGENKYQTEKACSNTPCPNLYSNEGGVIKCFDSVSSCRAKEYTFIKNGRECLKFCDSYIAGEDSLSDTTLIRCFDNQEKCKDEGLNYYISNSNPKKCYESISTFKNQYPNELGTDLKPKEDLNGNTFSSCNSNFPKLSNNYCKENCDDNECYYINNPKICKSVTTEYYYIDSTKKDCP